MKTYPTITVKRINGNIDTVDYKVVNYITPSLFAKIKTETAKAGRGEVMSYNNNEPTATVMTKAHEIELLQDKAYYMQINGDVEGCLKLRAQIAKM